VRATCFAYVIIIIILKITSINYSISADWISDSPRTVPLVLLGRTLTNRAPTAAKTIMYIQVLYQHFMNGRT
jgi:hypothetical protein